MSVTNKQVKRMLIDLGYNYFMSENNKFLIPIEVGELDHEISLTIHITNEGSRLIFFVGYLGMINPDPQYEAILERLLEFNNHSKGKLGRDPRDGEIRLIHAIPFGENKCLKPLLLHSEIEYMLENAVSIARDLQKMMDFTEIESTSLPDSTTHCLPDSD